MNIENSIKEFIATNLLYTPEAFPGHNETSFLEAGIVDSMGIMELVGFVQSRFGVVPEPREITPENFDSVARLGAFVRRKQAATTRDGGPVSPSAP